MTNWERWKKSAEKVGLDPVEALLWYITFFAMVITLIWVFAFRLHWLWPVAFFVMLIVEAGIMGGKMEGESNEK